MDAGKAGAPRWAGGRAVVAVLLAVVFLTVIGSSVGYVLGSRVRDARSAGRTTPDGSDTDTPTGKPCPRATEQDAVRRFKSQGGLVQVLYVKTDASEVWICRDRLENLFYQGHVMSQAERGGGPREPFTDNNSLILQTVNPDDKGGYVAENSSGTRTTRYRVSTTRLRIEYPDGRVETQDVVQHDP